MRSSDVVTLRGGLTVPIAALRLAWQLEERGFRLAIAGGDTLRVTPGSKLTAEDLAALRVHKAALLEIVAYVPPTDLLHVPASGADDGTRGQASDVPGDVTGTGR